MHQALITEGWSLVCVGCSMLEDNVEGLVDTLFVDFTKLTRNGQGAHAGHPQFADLSPLKQKVGGGVVPLC